jgi:hypothetical protein
MAIDVDHAELAGFIGESVLYGKPIANSDMKKKINDS